MQNTPFLNTRAAAELIGISPSTLNNSRTTGMLAGVKPPPHLKIGRSVRYRRTDLVQWLDQFNPKTSTSCKLNQMG